MERKHLEMALPLFTTRKAALIAGILAAVILKPELVAVTIGLAVVGIIGTVIYIALFSRNPERRRTALKVIKAVFGSKRS